MQTHLKSPWDGTQTLAGSSAHGGAGEVAALSREWEEQVVPGTPVPGLDHSKHLHPGVFTVPGQPGTALTLARPLETRPDPSLYKLVFGGSWHSRVRAPG